MRLFIDTNVWLSGLMGRGLCAELLAVCIESGITLLLDERVRAELFRIVVTKFHAGKPEQALIEEFLTKAPVIVAPAASSPLGGVPDPDDAWILAAALGAGADGFITGDQALLDLGQVEGLPIMSPRTVYQRLRGLE